MDNGPHKVAAEQRSARGAPDAGVGVGANARRGYQTQVETWRSRVRKLIGLEAGFHAARRDDDRFHWDVVEIGQGTEDKHAEKRD